MRACFPSAQSDLVLVHPDADVRNAIAHAAEIHGISVFQALDSLSGWTLATSCRARVLALPAAGFTSGRPSSAPALGPRLVALLASSDRSDVAVAALRAGASHCLLIDDPPERWIDVFQQLLQRAAVVESASAALAAVSELPTREQWNDLLIEEALRRSGGQIAGAARLLGMTRQALHQRQIARARQEPLTGQGPVHCPIDSFDPDVP